MHFLILGKNGQLANSLGQYASNHNIPITFIGKEQLQVLNVEKAIKLIEKFSGDIVINTTGIHASPYYEENPQEMFQVNTINVGIFAKACKEKNVPLVTISTDYVFDGKANTPYTEDYPTNPIQFYGISKLGGELAVKNLYHSKGYIIRTNGIYGGIKGSPIKGNFILNILKEAKQKDHIYVNNEQTVSPTSAVDLGESIFQLILKKAPGGIYHLVNEGSCTWYEFTREIFKLANVKNKLSPVDRKGFSTGIHRPLFTALANTKAKKLGIILPPWKDALARYIQVLDDKEVL